MSTRIREARELKAYGQAELARKASISPNTMWAIEDGRHIPRGSTLRKIADALGIPIEDLTRPAK